MVSQYLLWILIIFRDYRNNRTALFDGIEEGGIRAYSSHEIDEHENERAIDGLQDRVNILKRVSYIVLVITCYNGSAKILIVQAKQTVTEICVFIFSFQCIVGTVVVVVVVFVPNEIIVNVVSWEVVL